MNAYIFLYICSNLLQNFEGLTPKVPPTDASSFDPFLKKIMFNQ